MIFHDFVKMTCNQLDDYYLIAPDGGALKKIYKTAQFLGGVKVIECGKTRDVNTGVLSGFKVYADDLDGKTCVVVDDISDGGGTFIGLGEELKKKNAGKLLLVVTHGIFSKGGEGLAKLYDQIICTDSFSRIEDQYIEQIKLATLLK